MKIFNWVHRKFHHKDGFDRNEKKTITTDADTEVLLEQVKMADMLGGWKDGILTIGTFGFDPLKDFNQQKECPTWEIKEEEEDEEEEEIIFDDQEDLMVDEKNDEINPLVQTAALGHGFDDIVSKATNLLMSIDGISLSPIIPHGVVDFDNSTNLKYEKMEKRGGRRITLADLFSAESDNPNCKKLDDHKKVHLASLKKPRNAIDHTKNGILFAKKLLPRAEKDSRPIQKMQRLMTKMLKRKIHPDLDGKIHKKESKINPSSVGLNTNNKCGAINESISLLQPQDVVV